MTHVPPPGPARFLHAERRAPGGHTELSPLGTLPPDDAYVVGRGFSCPWQLGQFRPGQPPLTQVATGTWAGNRKTKLVE